MGTVCHNIVSKRGGRQGVCRRAGNRPGYRCRHASAPGSAPLVASQRPQDQTDRHEFQASAGRTGTGPQRANAIHFSACLIIERMQSRHCRFRSTFMPTVTGGMVHDRHTGLPSIRYGFRTAVAVRTEAGAGNREEPPAVSAKVFTHQTDTTPPDPRHAINGVTIANDPANAVPARQTPDHLQSNCRRKTAMGREVRQVLDLLRNTMGDVEEGRVLIRRLNRALPRATTSQNIRRRTSRTCRSSCDRCSMNGPPHDERRIR